MSGDTGAAGRSRASNLYAYLDRIVLKHSRAGEVRNVSLLVAIRVGADRFRQVPGNAKGRKKAFLHHLKQRGLNWRAAGHLACLPGGWSRRWARPFPNAQWQRAAQEKAEAVIAKLETMRLNRLPEGVGPPQRFDHKRLEPA